MLRTEKDDPRFIRTQSLILQAFTELLPDKGFQAVSVQDITEKAGINRATFYAHFPDKYALLDHSIGQMFRQELEKRTLNACHYSDENFARVDHYSLRFCAQCKCTLQAPASSI